MKIILALFLVFVVESRAEFGPVGPIKVESIGPCDPPVNKVDLSVEMKTSADDVASIWGSFVLKEDLTDDDTLLSVNVDTFEHDEWQSDAYTITDKSFFSFVNKCTEKIWTSFRESAEPSIEDPYSILKGSYAIDGFMAPYTDIDCQMVYGTHNVTLRLKTSEEVIVCLNIKLVASKPDLLK